MMRSLPIYSKCLGIFSIVVLLPFSSTGQTMTPPPGVGGGGSTGGAVEYPQSVLDEIARCGSPFDAHLHLEGQWFSPFDATAMLAEMTAARIDQGVIMAVYGPSDPLGIDPNEGVAGFVEQSNGRLFGLASLNTTHEDWEAVREQELTRLRTYLEMEGFVGAKLAPPHTRLAMNSTIMGEIIQTISETSTPIAAIHIGTTPFCGPFGDFVLGQRGLCTEEYVDPFFLEDLISGYPNVTFVMMHGGQDFSDGSDGTVPFYEGTLFDHTLELMGRYDNLVLEISAMLAANAPPETGYRNPLAFENLVKAVEAGMQNRTIYGSDANQFPGGISSYLISTVESLIAAGLSEEERCAILVDLPKQIYNIPETTKMPTPPMGTAAPSSASTPGTTEDTTAPSNAPAPTDAPTSSANHMSVAFFIAAVAFMTWMSIEIAIV